MSLEDFWQENKRFLSICAAGLVLFFVAKAVIQSVYADEARALRRSVASNQRELRTPRYGSRDERAASEVHDELERTVERLSTAVAFEPRPEFVLDPGQDLAPNQYFGRLDAVREELESLASRRGMRLPEGLGLEVPQTNSTEILERHMEALDLLDRVLRLALESRVRRVDDVQVELDPALGSRAGLGRVERTEVQLKLVTSPRSVVQLLELTQSDRYGNPLVLADLDVVGARSKSDEVSATLTFYVVRLRADLGQEEV